MVSIPNDGNPEETGGRRGDKEATRTEEGTGEDGQKGLEKRGNKEERSGDKTKQ